MSLSKGKTQRFVSHSQTAGYNKPEWKQERENMAITLAKEENGFIMAYSGPNRLFTKSGKLHGYTSGSVSIKEGCWIITYDEKGNRISTMSA